MSRRTFIYRAHGLLIASPFALPSALASVDERSDCIDVRVSIVDQQTEFPENATLFHGDTAGTFAVVGGSEILVKPDPRAEPGLLAAYVLGSGLGRILQQRGALVLHAAGLLGPQGVVLILGDSGAGKSTLAASVATEGFATIGDDVLALRPDRGFRIAPSEIAFKLSEDAVEVLGLDRNASGLEPVASGIAKSYAKIGFPPPQGYHLPAAALILQTGSTVSLDRLDPLSALAELDKHRYRPELIGQTERTTMFRHIAQLAERIPVFRLSRPKDMTALPASTAQVVSVLTAPDQPSEFKSK